MSGQTPKLDKNSLFENGTYGIHNADKPITGWKKIFCDCNGFRNRIPFIAQLIMPIGATIVTPRGWYKYRTDKAIVKSIIPADEADNDIKKLGPNYLYQNCECYSWINISYRYQVGKIHEPRSPLNKDIREDCASGIHFFDNRRDAEDFMKKS